MKWKSTIVLVVLVAGLGVFYLAHVSNQPTRHEYLEQRERVFPAQDFRYTQAPTNPGLASIATNLEIRDAQGRSIIFVREHIGPKVDWRIAEPVRTTADEGAVMNLLSEIEYLPSMLILQEEEGSPLEPAQYGLESPAWSLIFGFAGRSWTLNVGDRTPDGSRLYAARPDEPDAVFVIPPRIVELLNTEVDAWRDRAVLNFDPDHVDRLRISTKGSATIEIERFPNGWVVRGPVRVNADQNAVNRLLDIARRLHVGKGDFIDETPTNLAQYGLDSPQFRLSLMGEKDSATLMAGAVVPGAKEKRYAMTNAPDSPVFLLPEEELRPLQLSLDNLRVRNALSFAVEDVVAIVVTTSDEQTRIEKENSSWAMRSPAGGTVDTDSVKLVLSDLANLSIKEWFDAPLPDEVEKAGLAAPRITIDLVLSDSTLKLFIGAQSELPEWTYARTEMTGPFFLIPSDIVEKLERGPLAFLSRRILEIPPETFVSVRLVRPDGEFKLTKSGNDWTVNDLPPERAYRSAAGDIIWLLSWLEGTRLVTASPSDIDSYGLATPRIRAEIEFAGGLRTLVVGNELENGAAYAMIEGEARVVLLTRGAVETLTADLIKNQKDN